LFAREDGPFKMFSNIRKYIYTRTLYNSFRRIFETLNDGIVCIWCNSMWFSMIMVIPASRNILEWFYLALCVSTIVIIVEGIINGEN